jgi:hypothetical protein
MKNFLLYITTILTLVLLNNCAKQENPELQPYIDLFEQVDSDKLRNLFDTLESVPDNGPMCEIEVYKSFKK